MKNRKWFLSVNVGRWGVWWNIASSCKDVRISFCSADFFRSASEAKKDFEKYREKNKSIFKDIKELLNQK